MFSFVEISAGQEVVSDVEESALPVDDGSADKLSLSFADVCDFIWIGSVRAVNLAFGQLTVVKDAFVDDFLLVDEFALAVERVILVESAFKNEAVLEVEFALEYLTVLIKNFKGWKVILVNIEHIPERLKRRRILMNVDGAFAMRYHVRNVADVFGAAAVGDGLCFVAHLIIFGGWFGLFRILLYVYISRFYRICSIDYMENYSRLFIERRRNQS